MSAAPGGWSGVAEAEVDHDRSRSRSADVLLCRRTDQAMVEVWDWFHDVGGAWRTSTSKVARSAPDGPDGRVGLLWVVRATRRNRQLISRSRPVVRELVPSVEPRVAPGTPGPSRPDAGSAGPHLDLRRRPAPVRGPSRSLTASPPPIIRRVAVLTTRVDPRSDEARANAAAMHALVAELRRRTAGTQRAGRGGDERSIARHRERGKLPVRERIDRLLDPGAPFLELSPLAANGMYDDEAPGAGMVTGIGRVSGTECVIVANDATVKGGTYYPMTVKKHLRAQEIALAEPAAVHLPGRLRRRVPAAAGRCLPRPRALRPHLLQPGADVGQGHPPGGARDGL